MNENFDFAKYHNYINEMVAVLDDLNSPDLFDNLINKAFPIMDLLGIALITSEYVEKTRAPGLNPAEFPLPPRMQLGEGVMEGSVSISPKITDMVSVRVIACPYAGGEWDQEMQEEVRSYLKLYFNLVARVRVLRMFESRMFSDAGLPFVGNLTSMMRSVGALKQAGQLTGYTVYRMNITKFSEFNRLFGRHVGDQFLSEYIRKLKEFSDNRSGVYRLGGDNFCGLVPNEKVPEVHKFFEGYSVKVNDNLPVMEIKSRAGFYKIESNDIIPDNVLKRASATFGKTNEKSRIRYFNIMEEKLEEQEIKIENDFLKAMKKGHVVAYYQPKVSIDGRKIIGVEALCRWIRNGKVVAPFRFIPLLERSNQICKLDLYMLRRVCDDLSAWLAKGYEGVRVSVNFSRNNLEDKNLVRKIIDIIDEYEVPHELITIELTETAMEVDYGALSAVVNELRSYGVWVAVDDFGMGFSSLNIIKDLEWDVIKVDKAFVPDEEKSNYEKNLRMLSSVLHLANDIGIMSVVEGVETEEQLELVRKCGCRVVQGYFFDKPLSKQELQAKMLGQFQGECKWCV